MSCEPRQGTWTDERVDKLKKMVADGLLGPAAMGRELGVSRGAVSLKIGRLGLVWKRPDGATPRHDAGAHQKSAPARNAPLMPIARADGSPVTIGNVGDDECRFPCVEQHDSELRLCGRKAKPGSPYCESHSRKAFKPQKKSSP